MEARYAARKQQWLADWQVAPERFDHVLPRLTTCMAPFVATFRRQALDQQAHPSIGGLLSEVERQNIAASADRFGQDRLPLQRCMGGAPWEEGPLRQARTRQVAERVGHAEGVWVFAPSGCPTSGTESLGVARQWCGRRGKVANGPGAISLGDVAGEGQTLVDRRLSRPTAWTTDHARVEKAGVPHAHRGYRARPQVALDMWQARGTRLPHGWSAGEDERGRP